MKKILLTGIFGLVCSNPAFAAVVEQTILNADPTNWRLQTYTSATSDTIGTFFTPAPCANGGIGLPASGSVERTRYWDTVMTAKLSKKRMNIYYNYDNVANSCVINSYYLSEPSGN